jgi:hypothetical protein
MVIKEQGQQGGQTKIPGKLNLTQQKFFKQQNAAYLVEIDNILSIRATEESDADKLVDQF